MSKPQFNAISSVRGSPMGRDSFGTPPSTKSVSLFKVKLVDQDYDDGGAYWGCVSYPNSPPVWCARDREETYRDFCRAKNRIEAASIMGLTNEQLLRGN
jgi:hypothetical protein